MRAIHHVPDSLLVAIAPPFLLELFRYVCIPACAIIQPDYDGWLYAVWQMNFPGLNVGYDTIFLGAIILGAEWLQLALHNADGAIAVFRKPSASALSQRASDWSTL